MQLFYILVMNFEISSTETRVEIELRIPGRIGGRGIESWNNCFINLTAACRTSSSVLLPKPKRAKIYFYILCNKLLNATQYIYIYLYIHTLCPTQQEKCVQFRYMRKCNDPAQPICWNSISGNKSKWSRFSIIFYWILHNLFKRCNFNTWTHVSFQ